jgi:hypothetical protein
MGIGSIVWLAIGAAWGFLAFALKGRLAGFFVTTAWGAAGAYFFMEPVYSFRVSNAQDIAALVLYGTVGLVFVRTSDSLSPERRSPLRRELPAEALVDLKSVWMEPALGFEERLSQRHIEAETSFLQDFQCSHVDAVQILSGAVTLAVSDPEISRISLYSGRKGGAQILYVDAQRNWPPPLEQRVAVGKSETDCPGAEFSGWPSHITGTWFDNECGRTYQISLRRSA